MVGTSFLCAVSGGSYKAVQFNGVFSENEDLAHRFDYDWLYNLVMEVCVFL